MDSVFLLEHVYEIGNGVEERKRIGVYLSEEDARFRIGRLRLQPGFRDRPEDFVIQRFEIDRSYWAEGYGGGDGSSSKPEVIAPG
ncbi:hypothetical protein ACFVMC_32375 [Nocardia sp. NPDC127579]|uniref:hypothetical protein n=1 Tax=Nocardia sp. NPDC127579 TaxID=3345402 RepID=UPI00362D737F